MTDSAAVNKMEYRALHITTTCRDDLFITLMDSAR